MKALEHLEPRKVFSLFEELCAIPHGSGNTKAISDWCVAFARARGLEYHQDGQNNVIIIKEATAGYENAPALILQGHLDMVCEKEPGCPKDMDREGLELYVDGDFVSAKGTTLGGDDGIAVAMALALLDADDIPHPRLEAAFTVDEEIGMLGAVGLDVSPLKGTRLLNLDSEAEGVFTVSCAGGNVTACTLPVSRAPFQGTALEVTVSGLRGGHSGTEIHKGLANANMLLGRLLQAMGAATGLRIVSAGGGLKDNAIPVKAQARVLVSDSEAARAAARKTAADFAAEYRVTDPGVTVTVEERASSLEAMDASTTGKVICMLTCLPNGVQVMSADIQGLVQTSLNLGIFTAQGDQVRACFSVRSSVDSQKEMLKSRLTTLMEQLGGYTVFSGDYSGWEYRADSPLRELLTQVFREQYGRDPQVEAIHAGVECGIFAGKIPGLDCVSMGPDLLEIHTPRERMSISSVQRVWKFLLEVLKRSNA